MERTEGWPRCPDCGLTLVYCTAENIRAFSCACGYSKPQPGFLEQMGIIEEEDMQVVEKFVWKVWGQKILKRGAQVAAAGLAAWLLTPKSQETLTQMGIVVDKEAFVTFITGATYLGAEGLRNYLKVKVGVKWL